ncbi:MAG TPA: secondary thiamine-phosphate synthase enzyme YjbQ [Terriglobales bacterium]|nr:secondary thiamine-phosphate synthase enzyme YjbQ [Terriglobales bacterium]
MQKLTISTRKKRQVLDITEEIAGILNSSYSDTSGVCQLSVLHTTAAVTTADLDPGTDLDMLDAFEHMVPKLHYRHPHNPAHVPDHILSSVIGTSVAVPVSRGEMVLGTWQRVVLVELDGPRDRTLVLTVLAEQDGNVEPRKRGTR